MSVALPQPSSTLWLVLSPTRPPLPTFTFTPRPTLAPRASPAPSPLSLPSPRPTSIPPLTIPILMYHYVRVVDAQTDPLGYQLSVTPNRFAAQLTWLKQQGYQPVTMATVARCLLREEPCPPQAIALTFDDGYEDAYLTALPLLQKINFVATFYLVNTFIGKPGYLDEQEIILLQQAGMEIGAHTLTHRNLQTLAPSQAEVEISASKVQLAKLLGKPVVSFCYPLGKFDPTLAAFVEREGYTSATTTLQGFAQRDLFALPRLRVSGQLTQAQFEQLMQSYSPWRE